jgi:hypothetical protein
MKVPALWASIKPLSVLLAAITFTAMWNARKFVPKVPPILLGIAVGCALYYLGQLVGLGDHLGPVIASGERADGADDLLLWTSSTAKISWR